jgi:diguanylate cyclase (GGDEF)-like protein
MCWRQVAALESLRIASRTDQASGVMTRADFLEVAEAVVERCRKEREPVVLVAMALEGLRKLDDAGAWAERDALVAGVGQAISKRTRGDDLLGRFSDQSFVVLLRRMDVGLGRLIAEKLLAAGEACATHALGPVNELRFRVGVAGGALESLPLRGLLATALGALEQARRESLPLACAEKTGQRPVPQGPTDHRPVP